MNEAIDTNLTKVSEDEKDLSKLINVKKKKNKIPNLIECLVGVDK